MTGSIAGSTATVGAGASLGGGGAVGNLVVGNLVVGNGGIVAPGTSAPYSTLKVANTLLFQQGSIYAVGIAPNGANRTPSPLQALPCCRVAPSR